MDGCLQGRVRARVVLTGACVLAAASLAGCASTSTMRDTTVAPDAIDETATARDARTRDGRAEREAAREGARNRFLLATHRANYLLPIDATSRLNRRVYEESASRVDGEAHSAETSFQLSVKARIGPDGLWRPGDGVYFAFTLAARWQLYAPSLSRPLREVDYQPEAFYSLPLRRRVLGADATLSLGAVHQSNGQTQGLSRGWNRVYAELALERGEFLFALRPWYRLPETAKRYPDDPQGDDNPDIEKYLGHGDVRLGWRDGVREYLMTARANPATGKGAVDVGVSFPLKGDLHGYLRYFSGYGDTLIDYDHFQHRIGLGVSLSGLY